MAGRVLERMAGEWLLVGSLAGLILTSLLQRRLPTYTVTDFHVVYILFVFLVIIRGLEESRVLKRIAVGMERGRRLAVKMVFLTAVLAMFVTNDVALLTVVPLTLTLNVERKHILVILEALSANAASALTPFGNPQNIFIFYHYHVHPAAFIGTIFPFFLLFTGIIFLLAAREGGETLREPPLARVEVEPKGWVYVVFFGVFIVAVLKFAPLALGIVPLAYALVADRRSLRIDYPLLITFLAFFGFTDNLVHLLHFDLHTQVRTFLYAALGSQAISNVPSALLFADFTRHWRALLWGVSVGGFGNLVGSLASLIAYRLYKVKAGKAEPFLVAFHLYGYAAFLLGIGAYFVFG